MQNPRYPEKPQRNLKLTDTAKTWRERRIHMRLKKNLAAIFVLMILITLFNLGAPAVAAAAESQVTTQTIYTSASSWAQPEIAKAYGYGLIPDDILSKQSPKPATREELCELASILYEKTMEKTAAPASPNPFTDTDNPEILKAYALGITTGTSPTTFSPGYLTTREQVATMFSRAIRVMFPSADYSTVGAPVFSDQKDISSWALSHVLYMSKAGIIKGSNNLFLPRAITAAQASSGYGTTTREQAIAISVRIYETYKSSGNSSDIGKDNLAQSFIVTSLPMLSESAKLGMIDFNNRLFRPIYHPKLTLSAERGASAYSASPWSSLVSPDGDQLKTFKLSLPTDVSSQTSAIVWQVSLVPFDGSAIKSLSAKPGGLLLSGTLSGKATQFDVNFAKVLQAENTLRHTSQIKISSGLSGSIVIPGNITLPGGFGTSGTTQTYGQTSTPLRTYYVRAFPVDAAGNSIGDAGAGLPVLFGDPLPSSTLSSAQWQIPAIGSLFSLKPAKCAGSVGYDGEFPNNFVDSNEVVMLNTSPKLYSVLPAGFPANTQELRIQVSLAKFSSSSGDSWLNTSGLVYENSLFPGDTVYQGLADYKSYGVAIDFSKFVPSDSKLPKSEYVQYFVRAVALTPGTRTGTLNAAYSKTITINYGFSQATPPEFLSEVKIKPPIPTIEKVSYTPVQWETQGWQYHYVVTHQPTMKEVFGPFFASDDLYQPYTVGTKLDFTPQPENKSWWEEAWDSITSFFKTLTDFFVKVVNWVSNAYADLKSGLINIVVSALPSSWQESVRTALTAIVDYGLASMGIPPTLPNFDQLANMGTDYLATLAMEQAGIPANSLAEYGVDKLSDEIGDSLSDSAGASSPNPMNWNFVQLDPDCLYRPAYLTVELYNPYDKPTPAGKLSFTVDKFMDTSKNGSDMGITGLLSAYGSPYVCLYKPVFGMEIPSLYPGQRLTVPVILEEYVGIPFPGCTAPVKSSDYATLYGGLGEYNFTLFIQYDLPPIMEEAAEQGHTENAIYSYSALGNGRSFTLQPGNSYSK